MKEYKEHNKYLFSALLLFGGRLSFFIGLFLLGLSVYFGVESVVHDGALVPDTCLFRWSLFFLLTWAIFIIFSVVLSFRFMCDNCENRLCVVSHGCITKKRNFIISFFFPDDLYTRKFACSKCGVEYFF